ncbi:hypothetical protein BC827DRAFT_1273095 [Russula dissimulans]|nr:hypothetical protein BC827DRAFT_1273095 [Russula dissimulans]
MAGALRSVSQNYKWTIKRAHNDLHDAIHSQPQTPSHSHAGIGSVDIPLVSWDRGKFRTNYAELREHLEHSFLIFAMTVLHFVRIGTRCIITNTRRSVIRISQLALATLLFCLMSMWHLWVTLVRSAASLVLSLLREIFNFSLRRNAKSVSWAKVHADNTSSDPVPSQLAVSFARKLKDGIETVHTVMRDKATQLSHILNGGA